MDNTLLKSTEKAVPLSNQVLVEMEAAPEKTGSIYMADDTKKQLKNASAKATIKDIGSNAFADLENPEEMIGKRVFIIQYNGFVCREDPIERIIEDNDVISIIEEY